MPFILSPSVNVVEKDLTTTIPALATSITGFVGAFIWGPANKRTLLTSPRDLEDTFGPPTENNYISWFTAYNVLQYNQLFYGVRVVPTLSKNSGLVCDTTFATAATIDGADAYIPNEDYVEDGSYDSTSTYSAHFLAKYPGDEGDKIAIAITDGTLSSNVLTYNGSTITGTYTNADGSLTALGNVDFDYVWDSTVTIDNYRFGVVVVKDGEVVEKHLVSSCATDKDSSGNNIYFEDYINRNSAYIWAFGNDSYTRPASMQLTRLGGGVATIASLTQGEIASGYDNFANPEEFDVNILIDNHELGTSASVAYIQQYIVDNILESRKDCIGVFTVPKADVVNNTAADEVDDMIQYVTATLNRSTSYAAIYGNWKYQYDSFNDKYRWLPLSGDAAGIFARTDYTRDTWYAPAGFNRGQVKNVTKFGFKPDRASRDLMYKNNINPVLSFPGDGPVIYGQKTLLKKPSAFDRIDVRRLFIYLEKAISTASKYFLFEKNTAFTRRLIIGMIEPFLRDVQGREGLYDFLVVCDDTNNTGEVIDRNELVCDIYLKPTRTAEFIILNFIATKTGVNFSELLNQ